MTIASPPASTVNTNVPPQNYGGVPPKQEQVEGFNEALNRSSTSNDASNTQSSKGTDQSQGTSNSYHLPLATSPPPNLAIVAKPAKPYAGETAKPKDAPKDAPKPKDAPIDCEDPNQSVICRPRPRDDYKKPTPKLEEKGIKLPWGIIINDVGKDGGKIMYPVKGKPQEESPEQTPVEPPGQKTDLD